tara:strand:+ start:377 stop:616 length:240 start_codon:yes stop_codon:yes gene_type:complete
VNHPLTPNVFELSDSDLTKKINELNKRLVFAHTSGHGHVANQIHMMLDDYKAELQRREHERYEKINKGKDKDWDSLIDV